MFFKLIMHSCVCQLLALSIIYIPMTFMNNLIDKNKDIDWMSIWMIVLTEIKGVHSPCSK